MDVELTAAIRQAFPALPDEDVEAFAAVARLETVPPGTILCHEGRVEDTFYIVVAGRAEVIKQVDSESHRVLAQPGPGEFFGEIALVQQSTRTATVRAAELTTVLAIDRATFEQVLERSPRMAVQIIRQVTSRLRDADQQAIAELRRKNIELARAYAELKEQQRLRSEFLTTVAHELRTPLTTVMGYLHFLRSGALGAEQQAAVLETVSRNVETVVHLVNNILFLQELEIISPEFQTAALGDVVLRAVQHMRERAAEGGVRLQVDIDPTLPPLRLDPAGMERALVALIENAIKFTPDGGDVRIEAFVAGGQAGVRVSDPGVGIPPEELENIFEPFTRVERSQDRLFGGLGLGLPIARQVVQRHGGRIDVESRVGEGSTFTIILPLL